MLEMGHRFGDYELLRKIGSGGMAEVWVGRRVIGVGNAAKCVAVKVLRTSSQPDSREHHQFVEETRLSMLLSHSNIVQVFDAGSVGQRHYLVMEWVDGIDLAAVAQQFRERGQHLPDTVTAHCIAGVLQALDYAHSLTHRGGAVGVIHRDISPHNVLVSVSGEVKLADFGIARQVVDETSGIHIKGKLRYMAPEQLLGDTRGPSVDLYAVGVMLHEFLDGTRFRQGSRMDELQRVTRTGEIAPLSREHVPEQLDALRLGLLAPDPSERIQSAAEALELLRKWTGLTDATAELAAIVREQVGASGPRISDPHLAPTPGFSNTHLMPLSPSGVDEGSPSPGFELDQSPVGVVESAHTQTEISDVLAAMQPVRVQLPRILWGAVLGLGCLAGYLLWMFAQPTAIAPAVEAEVAPSVVEPAQKLDVPASKSPLPAPIPPAKVEPEPREVAPAPAASGEVEQHPPATRRPRMCGNGRCDTARGENCHSCARDCPCAGARKCGLWDGRYQCTAEGGRLKE